MKVVNGKTELISLFRDLFPILLISGLITTGIGIILALLYSHKIAGPIYRFKKSTKELLEGKYNVSFRVRSYDQFQELSQLLEQWKNEYLRLKENCEKKKNN